MLDELINNIVQTASYGGILAIIIALCEWIVGFIYRAITDKIGGHNRV